MSGILETIKNSLDYNLGIQPFFFVNQQRYVKSWLGAITTVLSILITLFLCLGDIKEIFNLEKPTVVDSFEDRKYGEFISFEPGKLAFFISVMSKVYDYDFLLDESIVKVNLYQLEGDEAYIIDLKFDYGMGFYIDENQIDIDPKNIGLQKLGGDKDKILALSIEPCQNKTEEICQPQEFIDSYLSSFEVYFPQVSHRINFNNNSNYFEYKIQYDSIIASNRFLTSATKYFQMEEIQYKTPFGDLISSNYTIVRNITSTRNTQTEIPLQDNTLVAVTMEIDEEEKIHHLSFNSIPSVLAGFYSLMSTVILSIGMILDFGFGYFQGNYYCELINALFKTSDNEVRSRAIKIYPRKARNEPAENILPDEGNINEGPSNENAKNNLVSESTTEVEFNLVDKITSGLATGPIFNCFLSKCSSCYKVNHKKMILDQGIRVLNKYLDIVFMLRKTFEFEQLSQNKNLEGPKLIDFSFDLGDKNFYKTWMKEQTRGMENFSDFNGLRNNENL